MPWPRFITSISRESFLLIHDCPQDFVLTKWWDNPFVYAIWSTFCSIYIMTVVIYSALESGYGFKILMWLTYWSLYNIELRFTFAAYNCWSYILHEKKRQQAKPSFHLHVVDSSESIHKEQIDDQADNVFTQTSDTGRKSTDHCIVDNIVDKQSERSDAQLFSSKNDQRDPPQINLPVTMRCQWFFQNISNNISIMVTLLYWSLVYIGAPEDYGSINAHVTNSVIVIADIMISRAPIRIEHFHITLTYLSIYIGFTVLYWAAGGTNHINKPYIYSILNYSSRPHVAALVICLVALIGVILVQILTYYLYRLRNTLYSLRRRGVLFIR
uniref:Protein rolling stone n=1 Tax=Arion vulgaris TaxID=1028688 RepID=A0A0B7AVK2_9EUPU